MDMTSTYYAARESEKCAEHIGYGAGAAGTGSPAGAGAASPGASARARTITAQPPAVLLVVERRAIPRRSTAGHRDHPLQTL